MNMSIRYQTNMGNHRQVLDSLSPYHVYMHYCGITGVFAEQLDRAVTGNGARGWASPVWVGLGK